MTIDEAFHRVVRGHRIVIVTCILLAMLAAGAVAYLRGATYEAAGRVELAGGLASSNVTADAASQRLQGIVTSTSIVTKAMEEAGIDGDPIDFAKNNITISRVGVSPVVEVAVVYSDRDRAVTAATSLIQQALNFTNASKTQQDAKRLDDLNKAITLLTSTRGRLINQLATAAPGRVLMLQAQIAAIEPNLADTLRQRADLILAASSRSSASLLDPVYAPEDPMGRQIPQQVALAGLAGLILGLGVASAIEAGRPRLRGPRSVATGVGAPLLGHLPRAEPGSRKESQALDEITANARLVSHRYGDRTLVLVPIGLGPRSCADLAAGVSARTGRNVGVYSPLVTPEGSLPADPLAVVVSAPVVNERELLDQRAFLDSVGWPLVGVVTVAPHRGSERGSDNHHH
jgi:hypothetical protein